MSPGLEATPHSGFHLSVAVGDQNLAVAVLCLRSSKFQHAMRPFDGSNS